MQVFQPDAVCVPEGHGLNTGATSKSRGKQTSSELLIFFGAVIAISLSGVMTPGPVFAATVAKGYKDEKAGIKIALGHGLVEFPLMILIALALDYFMSEEDVFENLAVKLAIGLIGGGLLIFLGAQMIRSRKAVAESTTEEKPYNTVFTGVITTSANPYFFMWWATIGVLLIAGAMEFGAWVVVAFAIVHWSVDLAWYSFTSFAVYRTKHLWTPRVQEVVFGICGAFMIAIGAYFIIGPALELYNSE